ncbi:MAG TPA: 2-amino-4-hydroxy-6-hydroxymethyldihydropteridine diphosphokinase [Thermoleophilaceae bacterium]|nr:2-amino-4-hydroxy-6-hydroxymethyldihydropteridine diphosphokinase [Thermoleophilaceae bacterium]
MRGYLGLGSNEGDRLGALRAARDELERHCIAVVASSSVYETAPQGEVLDQPDFLNACLAIETKLAPEQLLDACKEVEHALGRVPGGQRHGPRPIDVDVLLLGGLVHSSDRLTLPHLEVSARRFVLEPLLELDPELTLPDGTPLAPRLASVADQPVLRVGPFPAGQAPWGSGGVSPRRSSP